MYGSARQNVLADLCRLNECHVLCLHEIYRGSDNNRSEIKSGENDIFYSLLFIVGELKSTFKSLKPRKNRTDPALFVYCVGHSDVCESDTIK